MWSSKKEEKYFPSSNIFFPNQHSQTPLVWHESHPGAISENLLFLQEEEEEDKKLTSQLGPQEALALAHPANAGVR